jgi:hypothetical protein
MPLPPDVPFPPPLPGIPSPPIPELPALPPIPGVEIPPIPGIPNPLEAFVDFVDLQVALVTGIPNLLIEMIAKIPGFLPKLGDIKAILAEICGMVRDSGVFGNIKPSSTVQAAATIVLARKTAECLLNAGFASTIGMAPGSAGCAINEQISGYDVVKKKPAKKGPSTPSDRVLRWARGLAGVSAGQNDGEPYVSSLYFAEAALSQMPNGTVNLMGEPIDNENQATIENINAIESWNATATKFAPVENTYGQYAWARRGSLEHSSCALFARSCYYAGGFNAGFFTSLYPPSTAQSGLKFSFILRNYKWLKDDGTFNLELYNIMERLFTSITSIDGDDKAINAAAINTIGGLEVRIDPDGLGGYKAQPVNNADELLPYLKPFNERPYIGTLELMAIASRRHPDCPDFPALRPGDLIYVIGNAGNDHVSVLEEPRAAGFEVSKNRKLKEPFITIDGGQVDPYNKADVNLAKYDTAPISFPYGKNIVDKAIQGIFPPGAQFVVGDKVKQIIEYYDPPREVTVTEGGKLVKKEVNYSTQDITEDLKVGKPTAILRVNRDLGGRDFNGFSLGSENIVLTDGQIIKYNETRKIDYIARAELMLDEKENNGKEAGIAAAAQDELTAFLWRRRIEYNGGDIQRVFDCFPAYAAKQNKAAEEAKKAEKK